ncbi:MAG: quinone-dependent dihydroorotate dehydrogenase [Candidatus Binatia bacterium]|nr:quinone-dependent dihydroorotate dehydrogenase [Candidatus Binatia bacterium]
MVRTHALLNLAYKAFRPGLFALDPERAHEWTFTFLRLVEALLCRLRVPVSPAAYPALEQNVAGLRFPNPIGLAAGLDKNAEVPHVWALLGFGFAELGTLTAQAQPGNPEPRLWRFPAERALVNRMGFNNRGAEAVARELAGKLDMLRSPIPLGINIGKSRSTPLDRAADDYAASFARLAPLADYICVNVSSPNTPNLRDLQTPRQLGQILDRLHEENQRLLDGNHMSHPCPIFVKVAPDLSLDDVAALVEVLEAKNVAALVATNTTTARSPQQAATMPEGGLSGAPLRERATEIIRAFFRRLRGRVPIVGVGGVFSAEDAYEKVQAGASLVQLYTGLIYEGPAIVPTICEGLIALLERDGVKHIGDVIGARV